MKRNLVSLSLQFSPEQLNSCFCTSATLSPLSSAGEVHWVKRPIVGLCLSHWANQARWQSQFRLLEWRRLVKDKIEKWTIYALKDRCCLKYPLFKKQTEFKGSVFSKTHQIQCLWAKHIKWYVTWIVVNGSVYKDFQTKCSKHRIPGMLCLSRITFAVLWLTSVACILTCKPMCTDT